MMTKNQIQNRFVKGTDADKYDEKQAELEDLEETLQQLREELEQAEDLEDRRQLKRKVVLTQGQIDSVQYELSLLVHPYEADGTSVSGTALPPQ